MEAAAASIEWDEGRPRRARQHVSYTSEAYDRQFFGVPGVGGGRGRDPEPDPHADNPFVRRGRSAAAFADGDFAGGLPDTRRSRWVGREEESDDGKDSQWSAGSEEADRA